MLIFIETINSYNDFYKRFIPLEISYIVTDNSYNIIEEDHRFFEPLFGTDEALLNVLGRRLKFSTDLSCIETQNEILDKLNSLTDEGTKLYMWGSYRKNYDKIKCEKINVKGIIGEGNTLEESCKIKLGKELRRDSKSRVYGILELVKSANIKTEDKIELTISEGIEGV